MGVPRYASRHGSRRSRYQRSRLDPYQKREWVKEQLAIGFQYWGKEGYAEGLSGHITVRDPVLPDHYWMNAIGVHFSAVTTSNLVLVSPDGFVHPDGAQLPINEAGV